MGFNGSKWDFQGDFVQGKAEEMSEIHMNLETKIDGFTNSLEKSLETSFSNDGKIIGKNRWIFQGNK